MTLTANTATTCRVAPLCDNCSLLVVDAFMFMQIMMCKCVGLLVRVYLSAHALGSWYGRSKVYLRLCTTKCSLLNQRCV